MHSYQRQPYAPAVGYARRMHDDAQKQAERVYRDALFPALDLLPSVIAPRVAFLRRLHGSAVYDRRARLGLPPFLLPDFFPEGAY